MELQNSFTVPADVTTAWQTLLDVEAIAPCMPGATLESVDGDAFSGNVKVKLGPVSMVYGGQARFVSKDEAIHTAVIEGTGKETRGTGTAKAQVTARLTADGPATTRVDVTTELTITGKAAQFGRGVMQDVASRLIGQFSSNLEQVITTRGAAAEITAPVGGPSQPASAQAAAASPVASAPAEALDLGSVAMGPVLKRVIPIVVVVIAVAGVIAWIVNR